MMNRMRRLGWAAALMGLVVGAAGQAGAAPTLVYPNNPSGDSFTNPSGTNTGQAVDTTGWYYNNVRNNAVVGINGNLQRSGSGSLYFQGTGGVDYKADIEFYDAANANGAGNFNPTIPPVSLGTLGTLTALSYDWYRDASSTTTAVQHPSLRLRVFDPQTLATGYLVYEGTYNDQPTPEGEWVSVDILSNNFRLWATGSSLPPSPPTSNARTIGDWIEDFGYLQVIGISSGIGSGWPGSFTGAVDNITFGFTGANETYNFEVEAAAVPEPSTLAMAGTGALAGLGAWWRKRRRTNVV